MTTSNRLSRSLERIATALFLSAVRRWESGRPKRSPPSGNHRALICKWCCMGDAILSLYAIREFKRRNPGIALEMLVSSRIAEVYREAPEIDRVHVLPVTGRRLLLELINPRLWYRFAALIFQLRRSSFAQFVDLELYRGTGAMLKRLIGIPFSRGFLVEGALPKGHDFETPRPKDMPEWQCFYQVLGMVVPSIKPQPLYAKGHDKFDGAGKRIGIAYGSSFNWPQKKWPWEYYAETISLLASGGHEFVLLGSPIEKEESLLIAGTAKGRIRNTTGMLNYDGLKKEIASCDLVVGNDTGTLHLASACGIPTLTLFGPTNPHKWNGLTSTPLFLEGLACRPCYYLGSMPPCNHFSCLRKLAPSLVAERIRYLLLEQQPVA